MVIFMARNLEKGALATAEDKAVRIGKFACEKETCAIQACLQGINTYILICILKVFSSLIILNHAHQNITNCYRSPCYFSSSQISGKILYSENRGITKVL